MASPRLRSSERTRRLTLGTIAAGALLAAIVWVARERPSAEGAPPLVRNHGLAPDGASDDHQLLSDPRRARGSAAQTTPPPATVMASEAIAQDEISAVTPHPISDERLALAPPWATVDEVKAALKAKDFERARALLRERRASDQNRADFRDFYDGLELIADCLEHPGTSYHARAEAFITEHRSSPLRRHVRRQCGLQSAVRRKDMQTPSQGQPFSKPT